MTKFSWHVGYLSKKSKARTGCITTPHGKIKTPAFIFCATKAALKSFNEIAESNRKILIFGEMGELGIFSEDLHQKVYNYLISLDISLVIFIGNKTQKLYKSCNNIIECSWSENVYNAVKDIKLELFQPEDCILVKGSRHMKLEILVKHLIYKFKGK